MTSDDERFRQLYDVERHVMATDGGILVEDPYPAWAELRAASPVHEGTVRELMGYTTPGGLGGNLEGPVFSLFSFEANDTALRNNDVFSSTFYSGFITQMMGRTILEMVGDEHRRYRALAQPAFTPKRAQWWIDRWIQRIVDDAVSAFEGRGHAELNAELSARIPIQTITSSFGLTREEALDFRSGGEGGMRSPDADARTAAERYDWTTQLLKRIIDDRRANPQDDVITMLVQSELEEDGERHLLTDDDIYGFSRLILGAGSGTTWRQLGILLIGLLSDPPLLEALRKDRDLVSPAIEEAVRWEPTDPIFRRLVTEDVDLCGVAIPPAPSSRWCSEPPTVTRALGRTRSLRSAPPDEAEPGLRRWSARLPRDARRPRRDARGDQRGARPAPRTAVRPGRTERTHHRIGAPGAQRRPGRVREGAVVSAAPDVVGDKFMWTLVGPPGTGIPEFQAYVLEELAIAAGELVHGVNSVRVTLQARNAFCGGLVEVGGAERRVDVVLQITSEDSYVATDPVNSVLAGNAGHAQGWRVHPTTIHDSSEDVPLGTPMPFVQTLWINQRMDGKSPEFYSRNWYIHGGHVDGQEAETDESRVVRAQMEEREPGRWYIQNRVLEPITPTAWVVNGFADFLWPGFFPGPGERYNPENAMGEESFDRWPPRMVQGHTYRVI